MHFFDIASNLSKSAFQILQVFLGSWQFQPNSIHIYSGHYKL